MMKLQDDLGEELVRGHVGVLHARSSTDVASSTLRSIKSSLSLLQTSARSTMQCATSNPRMFAFDPLSTLTLKPSETYTSMERHVMSLCTDGGVRVTTTMGLMLHPSLPRSR